MSISQGKFGKYELRARLGEGGMAEVWKAFDPQLQRYVAIKFMHANVQEDPDFKTRFVREAQTVASLHHPNIIFIHDFRAPDASTEDRTPAYMVMNYVEGPTLAQYIHNTSHQGNFPTPAEIAHLFVAISTALDYAHQRGVIHRDVKPSNILLDTHNTSRNPMGEPILSDFGIVKLLGASNITSSKGFLGTPNYVSPEQARGYPGDSRSDIYSLGVILYEIWTGVRPFQGDNPFAIAMQHVTTQPTNPMLINPKIPLPVAEVILAGLAKIPDDRYSSAVEMTNALIQAINKSMQDSPDTGGSGIIIPNLSPIRPITPLINSSSNQYEQRVSLPGNLTPINDVRRDTPVNWPVNIRADSKQETIKEDFRNQSSNAPVKNPISNPPGMPAYTQSDLYSPTTPAGRQQVVEPETRSSIISPPKPARGRKIGPLFRILIALFLLLLLGSSLGTYFLFFHKGTQPSTISQAVVGNGFFISSGQVQLNNTRGVADKFQIGLTNIPAPDAGKNYYAWLLSDSSQTPMSFVALGELLIANGNATLIYPGDAQHTDLLATMSRLLITEESGTLTAPTTDTRNWRYYAEIPQKPDPVDPDGSALDRIRGLLSYNPLLLARNINVVLEPQFVYNSQALLQLADATASSTDPASIRSHLVNILDYLDGQPDVQDDLPVGIAPPANQPAAQLALISFEQFGTNYSFMYLMHTELSYLKTAPGITKTSAIYQLALDADSKLNSSDLSSVVSLFEKIRTDVKKLLVLSDSQLLASSSTTLLNDIKNAASSANSEVLSIDNDIQHLATFQIKPYSS